jgi:hypothetical protein
MEFLAWIEESALGLWVRESTWGFPIALTLHAIGMGFLAGFNFAFALRLLGVAPGVNVGHLVKFFPFMWGSAVLSLLSGLMLLAAYPAKSLTNPLFYLKMGLIIAGLLVIRKLAANSTGQETNSPGVLHARQKKSAVVLLLIWGAAITCGRFLAYTYSILTVSEVAGF